MFETLSLLAVFFFFQESGGSQALDKTQPHRAPILDICPVRFENFPRSVKDGELDNVSLSSTAQLRSVTLPRKQGIFLISVSTPDKDPIYGSWRVYELGRFGDTLEYRLNLGVLV